MIPEINIQLIPLLELGYLMIKLIRLCSHDLGNVLTCM